MLDYLFEQFALNNDFALEDHLVFIAQVGSHAYNLHTEESDLDYTAVCVPPSRHIVGLGSFESWQPEKGTLANNADLKVYSIEKAIRLLLKGNPSTLEILWLEPHLYLQTGRHFDLLIKHRSAFISKRAYKSLAGYARGQFQKMAAGKTHGYMDHKRKELVQAIGYDPKDASHLIRLLEMGKELAETGELRVWRTGASRERIMDIKAGNWKLEDVKALANELFEEAEAAFRRSALPEEPDMIVAEDILMEIQRTAIEQDERAKWCHAGKEWTNHRMNAHF